MSFRDAYEPALVHEIMETVNLTVPSELLPVSRSGGPPTDDSEITSGGVGNCRWVELVELWLDKVVKKRSSKEK